MHMSFLPYVPLQTYLLGSLGSKLNLNLTQCRHGMNLSSAETMICKVVQLFCTQALCALDLGWE